MKTIKQMRESLGYSQQELAEVCGMSRSMLSAIELGKKNPGKDNIKALAYGLEVSITKVINALFAESA